MTIRTHYWLGEIVNERGTKMYRLVISIHDTEKNVFEVEEIFDSRIRATLEKVLLEKFPEATPEPE